MGVNRYEDEQVVALEDRHLKKHGESYGTSHARESLRALCHIPHYTRRFEQFIKMHGESNNRFLHG